MTEVVFVKNQAGWDHAFHSWPGELGQWMTSTTAEVQARAIIKAPAKSGATKASIRSSHGYSGSELQSTVGVNTPQGLWIHEGTRPHIITPNNPRGWLSFVSARAGGTVFAKVVKHPGTRPNPFLADALKQVIGGFSI